MQNIYTHISYNICIHAYTYTREANEPLCNLWLAPASLAYSLQKRKSKSRRNKLEQGQARLVPRSQIAHRTSSPTFRLCASDASDPLAVDTLPPEPVEAVYS